MLHCNVSHADPCQLRASNYYVPDQNYNRSIYVNPEQNALVNSQEERGGRGGRKCKAIMLSDWITLTMHLAL